MLQTGSPRLRRTSSSALFTFLAAVGWEAPRSSLFFHFARCLLNARPPYFVVSLLQGVDLLHGGRKVGHKNRKHTETKNVYVNLLSKLYAFLSRRTDSGFNRVVLKRLIMSRVNRPPMGLARVARYMKGKEEKIAVIVGTVTDDIRLDGFAYPKLKIAALRFTEGARARLTQAGGEALTFDQLALLRPRGENTVLLRGRRNARVATRYFGTPGAKNSTTRPKIESEGRKVSLPFQSAMQLRFMTQHRTSTSSFPFSILT